MRGGGGGGKVGAREVRGAPGRGRLARPSRPGVDVYQRRAAAARTGVEHLAHALHRAAVEVDAVVVDAVELHRRARELAEALDVVVRPPREPSVAERGVELAVGERVLPARAVAGGEVLVRPGVAAAALLTSFLALERTGPPD